MSRPVVAAIVSIVLALWLLAQDPYTWGQDYGDVLIARFQWQMWASAAGALCLVIAGMLALSRHRQMAQWVILSEGVVFLLLNGLYVARDGVGRFYAVSGRGSVLLVFVIAGAICRVCAYLAARRISESLSRGP